MSLSIKKKIDKEKIIRVRLFGELTTKESSDLLSALFDDLLQTRDLFKAIILDMDNLSVADVWGGKDLTDGIKKLIENSLDVHIASLNKTVKMVFSPDAILVFENFKKARRAILEDVLQSK